MQGNLELTRVGLLGPSVHFTTLGSFDHQNLFTRSEEVCVRHFLSRRTEFPKNRRARMNVLLAVTYVACFSVLSPTSLESVSEVTPIAHSCCSSIQARPHIPLHGGSPEAPSRTGKNALSSLKAGALKRKRGRGSILHVPRAMFSQRHPRKRASLCVYPTRPCMCSAWSSLVSVTCFRTEAPCVLASFLLERTAVWLIV